MAKRADPSSRMLEMSREMGVAKAPAARSRGRSSPRGEPEAAQLVANPAHGEKGDFVKVTVTLSPEVYELLAREVMRRKMSKERDAQLSAVIREAVVGMLESRAAT